MVMNVRLVGFDQDNEFRYHLPRIRNALRGIVQMPSIRPEISIGNLLSMAVSCIAILSVIVGVAVYGTTLRADVDVNRRDIQGIKTQLEKQSSLNENTSNVLTELRVDMQYVRKSLERLESSEKTSK